MRIAAVLDWSGKLRPRIDHESTVARKASVELRSREGSAREDMGPCWQWENLAPLHGHREPRRQPLDQRSAGEAGG